MRDRSPDNIGNGAMTSALAQRLSEYRAIFLELFSDVSSIMSRASSAAHDYQTLRFSSNQRLAEMGLKRSELPRATFMALTKGNDP
jgi:hypothetical protein